MNTINKYLTRSAVYILLMIPILLAGQREQKIAEKIEAKKITFITQKLNLSPNEAQQFWPVYNEFQEKAKALRPLCKRDAEAISTDAEANKWIENLLVNEQKDLDLKKDYYNRFMKVLPPSKVATLIHLEEEFKHKMINSLRKRMDKRDRKE
jgi:hypothetical protein